MKNVQNLLNMFVDHWKKKVESYKDWFAEEAKYMTNEAKRPGKPKSANELFGIEGSFRKLNVDWSIENYINFEQ